MANATMNRQELRPLFAKTFQNWNEDNAARLSAAFSFYAVLSLAPLLVLAIAVATNFLGAGEVRNQLFKQVHEQVGAGAVEFLRTVIDKASKPSATTIATVLSLLAALFGASNLFGQLDDSVKTIWGATAPKGSAIKNFIVAKAVSITMALVFAILVLLWMVIGSVISYWGHTTSGFPGWPLVGFLVSVLFLTGVFSVTFKALPRGMVAWSDVWIPAMTTAVLFSLSRFILGLYFTYSGVATAYGSAGALVVILLWIYYASQIFFFGVEMTCVFAHNYGSQKGKPPGGLLPS